MNARVLLVGALLTIPLVVFLALAFRSDPRQIDSPLIGRQAPGFVLADLDGERVELAALRGRPVVINFWATWCQPCIVEHPVLLASARRYADRAVFLGVVYQDDPGAIRDFIAARGAWGPALVDPESRVAIAYGVYGAPETFFIDAEGTVREKVTGALDPATIDRLLGRML